MPSSSKLHRSSDISARMTELVTEICHRDGDITPVVEAQDLVDKLRRDDPEFLTLWLLDHASAILADQIRGVLRARRTSARHSARAGSFAVSARKFKATGDVAALGRWMDVRYVIDDLNNQRRLGDMRSDDLMWVANRTESRANNELLEAAFHRALAAKLDNKKVSEVFTEDQIDRMYQSMRVQPSSQTA